jgi:hypothetical protein
MIDRRLSDRLICPAIVLLAVVTCDCSGNGRPSPAAPSTLSRTAMPTHTFSGTVRAVDGGPLEGVRVYVTIPDTPAVFTDAAGAYTLADVPGGYVVFQKEGFLVWSSVPAGAGSSVPAGAAHEVTVNAKLQPTLALKPGVPLSTVVSPDDLTYSDDLENSFWGGDYMCDPCKEIFITPAVRGSAKLRLQWTGSTPLELWVGDYYVSTLSHGANATGQELTVDVSGNLNTILVGVGALQPAPIQPIPFQLTIDQQ